MKYDENKILSIISIALCVLLLGIVCADYIAGRRAETVVVTKSEIEQNRANKQGTEADDNLRAIAARYDDISVTVYVSSSGKYHFASDCSGIKEYTKMSLGKAIFMGYSACGRCDLMSA